MSTVLILNTDDTQLHTVSVHHAIGMLVRDVASVEQVVPDCRIGTFPRPEVLRLRRYVCTGFLHAKTPSWTKRGVLRRDGHRCAYCDGPASTVDHIIPQSRGGQNSWLNTVAACVSCNGKKANRTPEEAGMPLLIRPFQPTRRQLM